MAPANTADAWRQGGEYSDRSYAASRTPWPDRGIAPERSSRPIRTGPARPARPADRLRIADARSRDAADFPRFPEARLGAEPARAAGLPERGRFESRRPDDRRADDRRPAERRPAERRPVERRTEDRRPEDRRPVDRARPDERGPSDRPADPRGASVSARPSKPAAAVGGRVRGAVAVLGMFLVTLAGAGVDSFVGIGLGLTTLAALVVVTAVATLVVRRSDLLSVVVAPPLVFVAVALVNIGLAPSASLNLATVATLLVRGFPTMAIATGVALVLGLIRLAARR